MVGLVIVSHSRQLAEALVSLIRGTGNEAIPMVATGGVGEGAQELGTDAGDIVDAIGSVYSDEGVLVLTDLGSAVLSAELALEFLPDEQKPHIRISSAPLVEGAVSAAVQIGLGSSLQEVELEARGGLVPKQEHLDQPETSSSTDAPEADAVSSASGSVASETGNRVERVMTIINVHGLHARPAAKLIRLIGSFDAEVEVSNLSRKLGPVSGRSLNRLSSLNVLQNDRVRFSASGPQAISLLEAVESLVDDNFGEAEEQLETIPRSESENPEGLIGISDGIAIGKAFLLTSHGFEAEKAFAEDRDTEARLFTEAVERVEADLAEKKRMLVSRLSEQELEIFDAHAILLSDPELFDETLKLIADEGYKAVYAWSLRVQEVSQAYESLSDAYLRQRAKDVRDVGAQLHDALVGKDGSGELLTGISSPVVLFADDLTPTQTASFDFSIVKGVVTRFGGPTSHTAILCRALGIPAVGGFADMESVADGTMVIIDGKAGAVSIDPQEEKLAEAREAEKQKREELERLRQKAEAPAISIDGSRVEVFANIASPRDAEAAIRNGAEGSGLFRTEFLFLNRKTAPTEEEQFGAFVKVGEAFGEKPVIIRTFDIGGDKQIDYMRLPDEANPFLGVRGLRLYETHRELFTAHIRAILRAAFSFNFQIMVPMIAEVDECIRIRSAIEEVHTDLEREGVQHRWPLPIGAMIETPAAALLAGKLASRVDFFSIGSNDLTQYIMAAERGNPNLVHFADPLHPAVLSAIKLAVESAHLHGKKIGVCGEMGSDRDGIAALLALGVDEISMSPAKIPEAKERIRSLDRSRLLSLLPHLEEEGSAKAIRSFLKELEEGR
jgi:phosphocarrier protein FPr